MSFKILGSSPALQEMLRAAGVLAVTSAPLVLSGETGTGKESLGGYIHHRSGRRGLVPVNCATLTQTLLEAELYGHERGTFTGAERRKKGLVEVADGGTLFLDEIGELPLAFQPKFLRFLEEGKIRRVGGTSEIPVDVRVIVATHRDLWQRVLEGQFRQDLYYRLMQGRIVVPPLRDRGRDILLLARHFLKRATHRCKHLSLGAEEPLMAYPWPGNIRELRNLMFQASVRARGRTVSRTVVESLLAESGQTTVSAPPSACDVTRILAHLQAVESASAQDLCRVVQVTRTTLRRRLCALISSGRVVALGVGRARRYARGRA